MKMIDECEKIKNFENDIVWNGDSFSYYGITGTMDKRLLKFNHDIDRTSNLVKILLYNLHPFRIEGENRDVFDPNNFMSYKRILSVKTFFYSQSDNEFYKELYKKYEIDEEYLLLVEDFKLINSYDCEHYEVLMYEDDVLKISDGVWMCPSLKLEKAVILESYYYNTKYSKNEKVDLGSYLTFKYFEEKEKCEGFEP